MNKTLLITKLKTTNIGNQALSDELIKLYETEKGHLRVVGRPEGLFGYSIEKLMKTKDPVKAFEAWADVLVRKLQHETAPAFVSSTRRVELLSFDDFKVKNDSFFQGIKNIFRRYIHSDAVFAKAYRKRFLQVSSADQVVYSGAGEVGDNNIFLRQLLELRIAQKLGKQTFAINQSVEVVESPMMEICGHVYKNMVRLIVRGDVSKDKMIALGVPAEKIICFPDSAFLNSTPDGSLIEKMKARYKIVQPSVGINATKVASSMQSWKVIIELLRSLGYTVYFISNDPFGDKPIGEKLTAEFGIIPILEFIDYHEYSALLASFDFVISCRLHTNELSLTGGTPIIPIEGSHFKTTEVFRLVNYPIPVTNSGTVGWENKIMAQINALHKNKSLVSSFVADIDKVRSLSRNNFLR